MNRRHDERGSAAVEVAIAAPLMMTIVMVAVAGGRIALAQGSVQQAASDAARSASISRTAGQANSAGTAAAGATLANQGLHCLSTRITVDTSGFARPVGTPAEVTATVTCTLELADLAVPGLPGSRVVTATMSSPLDNYRGRT